MSLLFTEASANALITILIDQINEGNISNKPYVEIYAGTRPCTTETLNGDNLLLATVTLNDVPFNPPVNGMAFANSTTPQTNIPTGGTATWFRLYNRDSIAILDGDITSVNPEIKPGCESGLPSRGYIDGDLVFDFTRFYKGDLVGINLLVLTTPAIS